MFDALSDKLQATLADVRYDGAAAALADVRFAALARGAVAAGTLVTLACLAHGAVAALADVRCGGTLVTLADVRFAALARGAVAALACVRCGDARVALTRLRDALANGALIALAPVCCGDPLVALACLGCGGVLVALACDSFADRRRRRAAGRGRATGRVGGVEAEHLLSQRFGDLQVAKLVAERRLGLLRQVAEVSQGRQVTQPAEVEELQKTHGRAVEQRAAGLILFTDDLDQLALEQRF